MQETTTFGGGRLSGFSRGKQTHSRLTLQLDSADRDIYFPVIMVARPFRFHSPDASTHLILSDEINGDWEQFSVTIRAEKYHVWLHDRWKYYSLKSRLQQKLSDMPEDEQLLSVLTDFFRQYPSEYACILIGSGKTAALVDHMRSVPLFYTRKHGECFLSDRPENLIPHMTPRLSKAELRKYLLAGYVPGRRTLLKDIYQIPAGEYVRWEKGDLRTDCYYHFWRTDSEEFAFEEQVERYRNLFLEVMDEFLRAHRGQNIVLLLSGGMDSRFILWALYALAPSNRRIHLLTYGRPRRRDAGWGYDTFVIGCTELSIILNQEEFPFSVFDASEVLAREVVRRCQGE